MHVYHIPVSTLKRMSQFNFKIHEVDHQEYLAVNENVVSH
jgi:hypothetical protein